MEKNEAKESEERTMKDKIKIGIGAYLISFGFITTGWLAFQNPVVPGQLVHWSHHIIFALTLMFGAMAFIISLGVWFEIETKEDEKPSPKVPGTKYLIWMYIVLIIAGGSVISGCILIYLKLIVWVRNVQEGKQKEKKIEQAKKENSDDRE